MPKRQDLANAIRALSMDAVQQANSGHPGMPMGMADIAEVLWNEYLQHNPSNPNWLNRDRFIVSNGHGCMLLYSLLHLTGYGLSLEDLERFRQLHSHTPGHPEYGETPGVETTTGPLGQGIANGIGMAIAEKALAAQFNQPGHEIIDHYTYVFLGDGCLMEGISHEVCSLAGTLGLGKLIAFYDDNGISIDGEVSGWFTDDTPKRFEAYDWNVIPNVDGHNPDAIKKAIESARAQKDKPTLICCKTQIGHGSPNLGGSHHTHGAPLGNDEIAATRKNIGWPYSPFEIPDEIRAGWNAREKGKERERRWDEKFKSYQQQFPAEAAELERRVAGDLPKNFAEISSQFIQQCQQRAEDQASRKASKSSLDAYGPSLPEFIGGSADLTGSNLTWYSTSKAIDKKDFTGNYVYYGVREFGMFAIMNGIALHGGFIPFGGTFLTFIDYGRNAIRLAAMMRQRVIYVLTHDSIGLGEDGPTHQPIEHASILRLTPNLQVWRPCDATETAVAWQQALQHKGPSCLLLSRQTIAHQKRAEDQVDKIKMGGYVLLDTAKEPEAIIISTGSEVPLAMAAAKVLMQQDIAVRVVSMPNVGQFLEQSAEYQEKVLPRRIRARVVIEAGATTCWYRFVGSEGVVIGIDRYGYSAPYQEVYQELGITEQAVVLAVKKLLSENLVET